MYGARSQPQPRPQSPAATLLCVSAYAGTYVSRWKSGVSQAHPRRTSVRACPRLVWGPWTLARLFRPNREARARGQRAMRRVGRLKARGLRHRDQQPRRTRPWHAHMSSLMGRRRRRRGSTPGMPVCPVRGYCEHHMMAPQSLHVRGSESECKSERAWDPALGLGARSCVQFRLPVQRCGLAPRASEERQRADVVRSPSGRVGPSCAGLEA